MILLEAFRSLREVNRLAEVPARRAKVILLLALGLGAALLEIVSVGLVFPLVTAIGNPEALEALPGFKTFTGLLGLENPRTVLLALAGAAGLAYLVKAVYTLSFTYVQGRMLANWQKEVSQNLYTRYLHAPYAFHLRRNSAELMRNVVAIVQNSYRASLTAGLDIAVDLLMAGGLALMLLYAQPLPALVAGICLVLIVVLQTKALRGRHYRLGVETNEMEKRQIQAFQQTIHSVKEIRILGREAHAIAEFAAFLKTRGLNLSSQKVFATIPTVVIETALVSAVLAVLVVLVLAQRTDSNMMAALALLAAAAFRLKPIASRLTVSFGILQNRQPGLSILVRELRLPELTLTPRVRQVFPFNEALQVENLGFSYPGTTQPAIQDISFLLRKGESLGIVGSSGAGKSTLADLILGLLRPDTGKITVDGHDIQSALRSWQAHIGYVPQQLYVADASVRANVAYAIAPAKIDENRVWSALRIAQMEEVIRAMPQGLDTVLGDRGARISGGQRQRIGIARALYHDPDVLLFDEATSALDGETEKSFSDAIATLKGQKTLIVIAHRLSTLEQCDRLLFLQDGKLVASGTFSELAATCPPFRRLVELAQAGQIA